MALVEVNNISVVLPDRRYGPNSFKEKCYRIIKREVKKPTTITIVEDLSFTLNKGEGISILGKNGAGKSTLLNAISGFIPLARGSVILNGSVSFLKILTSGFQGNLTAQENVYLVGSLRGFSKREIAYKLEEILDFAELGEFRNMCIKYFSSGMRARLGFSMILLEKPDILIIDEALSVGDASFKKKCASYLKGFRKTGGCLLLVTHSEKAATNLTEKSVVIKNGSALFFDLVEDALSYLGNKQFS